MVDEDCREAGWLRETGQEADRLFQNRCSENAEGHGTSLSETEGFQEHVKASITHELVNLK